MDEQDWLLCSDPAPMVRALREKQRAAVGVKAACPAFDRKLRLWACAGCRRLWPLLADKRSRRAVAVAERFADGKATEKERHLACVWGEAARAGLAGGLVTPALAAATLAANAATPIGRCVHAMLADMSRPFADLVLPGERAAQANLLREVFGNPWCPLPPRTFPAHVTGLAESIYAAFPAVSPEYAILADALEELGEAEAAAHCRQDLHAKGCFVVDWITRRK